MSVDFAVLDLETDPFKVNRLPRCFAGGFFDGRSLETFWEKKIPDDPEEWWGTEVAEETIARAMKFPGTVYIHNGGKFDLHHLLDPLMERATNRTLVPETIGSRMVALTVGNTTFRDSFALVPKGLASWGKGEIDYIRKMEADVRLKYKKEIIAYLKEDLHQLYDMMAEFRERFGRQKTLASTAFDVMKKQFNVKLPNTSEWHDTRFRPYYFAGMVRYFGLGEFGVKGKPCYRMVDINSAFPDAMTRSHWFEEGYQELTRMPRKGAEQCFYIVRCNPKGCLAFRKDDGSVDFPHDYGVYRTTGWELINGIKLGLIKKPEILKVFKPEVIRDLGDYVRFFYYGKREAKEKGDKATEYFYKIMLNAGYGKFAIDPRQFRDVVIRPFRSCPCGRNHVGGPACKEAWEISYDDEPRGITFYQRPSNREDSEKPMRFYNVCTAASITGYVRARLNAAMHDCEDVLYCDTDALLARDVSRLDIGDELGEFKLEKTCDLVWIGGKKLYALHDALFEWFPDSKRELPEPPKGTKDPRWVRVDPHGWTVSWSFKKACKGANLNVEGVIDVCRGEGRKSVFEAPSYSVFSPPHFVSRSINRADKRTKPLDGIPIL